MNVTYPITRRSKEQIAALLQEVHFYGLTQTASAKQHGLNQSPLYLPFEKSDATSLADAQGYHRILGS
jgi:hypothetical protein